MFAIGGRTPLTLDGEWAGVQCEVDTVDAWALRQLVASRASVFVAAVEADDIERQVAAFEPLLEAFVAEARPVWNLVSPKGPIPTTVEGCCRIPVQLVLVLVEKWLDTFEAPKPRRSRAG